MNENLPEKCKHEDKHIKEILNPKFLYYCENCSLIMYKKENSKMYKSIKPELYQDKIDFSPLELYKNAYKNTPFKKFSSNDPYYEKRRTFLNLLEKFNTVYKFSEETVNLAITYMDAIISYYNGQISKRKDFELITINSLIIAAKFYEKDLTSSLANKKKIFNFFICDISEDDLQISEINCLIALGYKLDRHSIFDSFKMFISNGFLYENELKDSAFLCNVYNNYALNICKDIIYSEISLLYPPYVICFSIIYCTREHFGLEKKYTNLLKYIYEIKSSEYKECLSNIHKYIKELEKNPSIKNTQVIFNDSSDTIKKDVEKQKIKKKEYKEAVKNTTTNKLKKNKSNINIFHKENENKSFNDLKVKLNSKYDVIKYKSEKIIKHLILKDNIN